MTHVTHDPWITGAVTPYYRASLTQIYRNAFLKLLAGFIFDLEFYCKLFIKK